MSTFIDPDALALADLLRAEWPIVSERIRLSGHPTCEGDDDAGAGAGDGDPDGGADDDDTDAGDADNADGDADPDQRRRRDADDDADRVQRGDSPTTKARKWERQAKRRQERLDALEAENKQLREANQTESERAIAQAKEQARSEAIAELSPRQKSLALELAVTRLASVKGVKVGDGDDAKTIRFADPDDVQMWLERQMRAGELAEDDIYADDGSVDRDALRDALITLAQEKPTWLAGANGNGAVRPAGDADGGKGRRPKDPDALSVAEHMKHIQRR